MRWSSVATGKPDPGPAAPDARRPALGRLLDAGTVRVRGGAPFDRDERFRIHACGDGFVIDSHIRAASDAFEFRCRFEFHGDWLPARAAGRGRSGDDAVDVLFETGPGVARLAVTAADGTLARQELALAPGQLLDLEPSVIPMWAMTRRYDRAAGGSQPFLWAGRSLTRGIVLQGGQTELTLCDRSSAGERFEFTETLPGPDGTPFHVDFQLDNDADGWLRRF